MTAVTPLGYASHRGDRDILVPLTIGGVVSPGWKRWTDLDEELSQDFKSANMVDYSTLRPGYRITDAAFVARLDNCLRAALNDPSATALRRDLSVLVEAGAMVDVKRKECGSHEHFQLHFQNPRQASAFAHRFPFFDIPAQGATHHFQLVMKTDQFYCRYLKIELEPVHTKISVSPECFTDAIYTQAIGKLVQRVTSLPNIVKFVGAWRSATLNGVDQSTEYHDRVVVMFQKTALFRNDALPGFTNELGHCRPGHDHLQRCWFRLEYRERQHFCPHCMDLRRNHDSDWCPEICCWHCREIGHTERYCPDREDEYEEEGHDIYC